MDEKTIYDQAVAFALTEDEAGRLPVGAGAATLALDRISRLSARVSQLEGSTRAALAKINAQLARHDGDLEELSVIAHAAKMAAEDGVDVDASRDPQGALLSLQEIDALLDVDPSRSIVGRVRALAVEADGMRRRIFAAKDAHAEIANLRQALDRFTRELVDMTADRDRWVARVKGLEDRAAMARTALEGRP